MKTEKTILKSTLLSASVVSTSSLAANLAQLSHSLKS